mmetsp:Transcript_19225/g.27067  ORF Transcript_19225/g.27067 Transcript_19225/m.27067 type:complete len:163 (+) Transcript_19225:94-582(+)
MRLPLKRGDDESKGKRRERVSGHDSKFSKRDASGKPLGYSSRLEQAMLSDLSPLLPGPSHVPPPPPGERRVRFAPPTLYSVPSSPPKGGGIEDTEGTQLESFFDAQRMGGFGYAERLRKEGIEHLATLEMTKNEAVLNELASKIGMKPGHRLKFVLAILRED